MKDKYNSILALDGIALRVEILRRIFDLNKDYAIIHEVLIVSDDFLKDFVLEHKRLSKELKSRAKIKNFLLNKINLSRLYGRF